MAEEGNMMSIIVVWRGKQLNVVMNQSSTLEEFGLTLQQLTNVKPDTMRLLVPRSTNRSSKLLTPFWNEHSKFSLQELDILEGKSIKMMGSFAYEVEEILQNSSKDLRIAGFEEEEKRLMQRKLGAPQTFLKLPQGPYIFREFHTLQIPGIELNPPATEALQRMHMLASDPGIVAIMNKHRWTVGIMTELAPVGYVGVSPKCILGLNKNHGEEISLRLRTDDLKGFRKYESIKKTLLHELAHMVYSEHDDDFFALDRQLNKEAESLDWTKSKGYSLGGLKFAGHNDMEEFNIGASHARKLGGGTSDLLIDARANSVEAAYRRLLNSSIDSSTDLQVESIEVNSHGFLNYESGIDRKLKFEHKTFGELDPDDSRANDGIFEHKSMFEPDPNDSQENLAVLSETSMEIEKSSGAEQCDEPDPDDSNRIEYEQASEPDPDDSEGGRAVQYNPYMRINGKPHPRKVISGNILGYNMDEPDPDDCQAIDAMDEPDPDDPEEAVLKHRNMFKPISNYSKEDKPVEAEPDPDENMVEPDPDDSQAIEASVESHLKVNKEVILEKNYKEPDPDDCEFREATFETDSDDYKQNKTVEFEPDPDDAVEKPLLSLPVSESSDVKIDESNKKVNKDSLPALELASADQELQRIHDPVSIICARIQKAIEILKSEATPLEATSVLQTLYKIIRNVIEHPDELKFKRLRKANPTFQRNVANYKAAIEVLHAIGFYEDIICDEIGKREAYLVLKRNDPALLWLAKSSLEQLCIA